MEGAKFECIASEGGEQNFSARNSAMSNIFCNINRKILRAIFLLPYLFSFRPTAGETFSHEHLHSQSHNSSILQKDILNQTILCVAVHLGVKMADTQSFTAKVDMVDF